MSTDRLKKIIAAKEALGIIQSGDFNGAGFIRLDEICRSLSLDLKSPMVNLIEKLQEMIK